MVDGIQASRGNVHYLYPASSALQAPTASRARADNAQTDTSVTLSSLAQQLNESAIRAEADDAALSRDERTAKAEKSLASIVGARFFASRQVNNAEIPDSSDPERLARAQAATRFVNGSQQNPFEGLSRDRLALITYDDSGQYTTNERRAAWEASFDKEYAWRKEAVAKAMAEYDGSGKLTDFFKDVLQHFDSLPLNEQAQYPKDYATRLQKWIALDYNYFTNAVEGEGSPL